MGKTWRLLIWEGADGSCNLQQSWIESSSTFPYIFPQPRYLRASSAAWRGPQSASVLRPMRFMPRTTCASVETTKTIRKVEMYNPYKESVPKDSPQAMHFPVAFLQLETCHLLLQDHLNLPMLFVRTDPTKPFLISWFWMKCKEKV